MPFPKTYNPKASGMLPWSDDTFRISVFGLPHGEDVINPALNNAVIRVLNSPTAADLLEVTEMRAMLDAAKDGTTRQFGDVPNGWRADRADRLVSRWARRRFQSIEVRSCRCRFCYSTSLRPLNATAVASPASGVF